MARSVAAEIAAQHGANSVASEICDVSDESAVKRLVGATLARFGQIDVLVNNAALYAPLHEQKFTEIDVELWDKVMAVNLRGPFLMAKHVAPEMAKRKYGKIINIGSGTAVRGIPWIMHYVDQQGRHHGDDARDVARARRRRHPRQHADAGLHARATRS